MMRKYFRRSFCGIALAFGLMTGFSLPVAAAQPAIQAVSAIMIDETTEKVLYSKDEHKKIYPASTTKILTALIALEYMEPDEYIVTGDEVLAYPPGSSLARIKKGETIRVDNLIRLLMIPSGNETACVVAREVAKREADNQDIAYPNAERLFSDLMNKKAKELGATESNFVNPHGFHNDNHYTTAADMAVITKAAMENPLIRQIVGEKEFVGNGAGENPDPSWFTQEYNWKTHNELLLPGEFYYPDATGVKTGFTDQAGDSLVASATRDGKNYIAVIFFSPDPGRWQDAKVLFNYGFETFHTEIIQESGQVMGQIRIANPRLGASDEITVAATDTFTKFMSKEELSRVTHEISYDEALVASPEEPGEGESLADDGIPRFKTPIAVGQELGKVEYYLDGELIFTGLIVSQGEALERTFNTDVDYYLAQLKANIFTVNALPFWIGGIVIIVLIIMLIVITVRKKRRKSRYLNRRY